MNKDLIVKQIDNKLIENDVLKEDNKEVQISSNAFNNLHKKGNEINEELIFKVNGHEEKCIIHGERDIKKCSISFNSEVSKKTIDKAVEYSFNILQMETVFIEVGQDDINTIKQLNKMNFEDLGLVNDKLTFLIEREEKELGSVIDGYNKKH